MFLKVLRSFSEKRRKIVRHKRQVQEVTRKIQMKRNNNKKKSKVKMKVMTSQRKHLKISKQKVKIPMASKTPSIISSSTPKEVPFLRIGLLLCFYPEPFTTT